MPVAGVEPARCRHRRILSPVRLPIPSHRQEFSSKTTTPENGGHFGGQTSKIKDVQFSKAQIFRAVPGSEGEMTKGILSPPRLPIPTHRQEFSSKNTTPEIGGHFGGQTSKIKDIQFSKAQINRAVPASEREMTHWILSLSRLPIPSFRHCGSQLRTVLYIYIIPVRKMQVFFRCIYEFQAEKQASR